MPTYGPIEHSPRRIRPPYDASGCSDPVPARGGDEGWKDWWARQRGERVAALLEPLSNLEVSRFERQELEWLATCGVDAVAVVSALLHRARAAAPLKRGGHDA